jgi:dTDP-4-dehydrorhamnose 3,5-epimerase
MHFQRAPKADAKVVRCSHGRIHDVVVDLREGSPTSGHVFQCNLGEDAQQMLYVPAGFAHGFQTLTDNVIVEYLMGVDYAPELYDGARYDDPVLSIEWPEPVSDISDKDLAWPDLGTRMPWLWKEVANAFQSA